MSRRRIAAGATLALLAAVAVIAFGGSSAPADRADTLVPADAIAYLHVSTDPDRERDRTLFETLGKFAAFDRLRAQAENALGKSGAFDFERDVRSWLGDEAAVAVTPQGTTAVLAVEKESTAQGVLTRVAGSEPAERHGGTLVRRFGTNAAAFTGGFLVLGPVAAVNRAIDVEAGRAPSLDEAKAYAAAADDRPEDRAVDLWTAAGAPALLLPPAFAALVGAHPVTASLVPDDDGLHLEARRLGRATKTGDFKPDLLGGVPEDAFGYAGLRGLGLAARFGIPPELGPLLRVLDREVAVSIAPASPEPIITLAARTTDPRAARESLAGLQGRIAELLAGSGTETGQVPTFEERDLGKGLTGYALRLAGGGELVYAVAGETVLASTAEDGVRRAARDGGGVQDADAFERAVPDVPETVQALGFLATRQLLELGDEAGLDAISVYRAARPDIEKVDAVGFLVRRQENDTTAELNLLIP